jgi:hypothetical protein
MGQQRSQNKSDKVVWVCCICGANPDTFSCKHKNLGPSGMVSEIDYKKVQKMIEDQKIRTENQLKILRK